jgi:hypothetical protein
VFSPPSNVAVISNSGITFPTKAATTTHLQCVDDKAFVFTESMTKS